MDNISAEEKALISKIVDDVWYMKDKYVGWDRHSSISDQWKTWFTGGPDFDKFLIENFKDLVDSIHNGEKEHWLTDRDGRLAYILCLDQFSRNIYRGTGDAFRSDKKVCQVAQDIIDNKEQRDQYKFFEKQFIYMPLMHAEDATTTQKCIDIFTELQNDCLKEFPGDDH